MERKTDENERKRRKSRKLYRGEKKRLKTEWLRERKGNQEKKK